MTIKKKKETLVLLDAHAILHRAYHALPDFSSPSGEPTGALYGVVSMILKIVEELKPDYLVACYDLPTPTHRHEAYAGYKAGRVKTDDTLVAQIERSRDICAVLSIPIYELPGFEADDMLGTIAAQTKQHKDLEVVIASGDMDTLQLVEKKRVKVYTLKKGINDTILYDEAAVKERFGFPPTSIPDYKGLRGDPSDNIPGIPGIGEKSGGELVRLYGTIERLYAALHKDPAQLAAAGIKARTITLLTEHEEEAVFSKMLATIRTDAPVTFELPAAHWRESVDVEATLSLCSELGFRTLAARIRTLFAVSDTVLETTMTTDQQETAAIKLWLLESDRTNSTADDIIDYGRTYLGTDDPSGIMAALDERLRSQDLWQLYETIEAPLRPVITHINSVGVLLDVPYLHMLSKTLHKELIKLEKDIYQQAGCEFNLNSPKQLGDVLFDTLGLKPKNQKKTAGGQRSTRESELTKMIDLHPIIASILRYRELAKLVSTYIDTLPQLVGEDGRVRTTFLQTGTTTGRLASQSPNLQNIPVRSEEGRAIRKAFIASPGYTLVSIDYSQIELRIAAMLSEDKELVEIFKRGEDVHAGVAMRVFGVAAEDVTREMRRKAKVINFGILYGMGVNALRQNLGEGTTREEAQEFLNAYFNTFTRLAEYLEETKAFARTHGYTVTMFGRRRQFPGINSGAPFIRAAAERMAINAPIQGTEGDILRIAMIRMSEFIKQEELDESLRMLLQVHDELLFEVQTNQLETLVPKLVAIMQDVFVGRETHGVPVEVEVKTGPNWQELSKYNQS